MKKVAKNLIGLIGHTPLMELSGYSAKYGLEGNIDGFQMIADDSLNIMVTHVCQCYIVSLDERQSGIVILEIEGISHSRGHLINEAENAVVAAGAVIVHQVLGKFHAQVFFVFLLYLKLPDFSVGFLYLQYHIFLIHQIAVIKYIFNRLAVYTKQGIPRHNLQFLGNAPLLHCRNHMFFLLFHIYLHRFKEIKVTAHTAHSGRSCILFFL